MSEQVKRISSRLQRVTVDDKRHVLTAAWQPSDWQTDEPVLSEAEVEERKGVHQGDDGRTVLTWLDGDADNGPTPYGEFCLLVAGMCLFGLIFLPVLVFYGCWVFIVQVLFKRCCGIKSAEVASKDGDADDVVWHAVSMACAEDNCPAPVWASVILDHKSGTVELRKGIATVNAKNPKKAQHNYLACSSKLELGKVARITRTEHPAMARAMETFFINDPEEFCFQTEEGKFFVFHVATTQSKELREAIENGVLKQALVDTLPNVEATSEEEAAWRFPARRDGCIILPYGEHVFAPVGDLLGKWDQSAATLGEISALCGEAAVPAWQLALRHLVGHTAHCQLNGDGEPVAGFMWWLKHVHMSGLVLSPCAVQMRCMSKSTGRAQHGSVENFTKVYLVVFSQLLPSACDWADVERKLRQAFAGLVPMESESDNITKGAKSMRVGPFLLGGVM